MSTSLKFTHNGDQKTEENMEQKEQQAVLKFYTIFVRVSKGINLEKADTFGKSDPYCIVSMDNAAQKQKTKCINKTLNPVWNESFNFYTFIDKPQHLTFELFDWDGKEGGKDDPLGIYEFELLDKYFIDKTNDTSEKKSNDNQDKTFEGKVKLQNCKTGELEIMVECSFESIPVSLLNYNNTFIKDTNVKDGVYEIFNASDDNIDWIYSNAKILKKNAKSKVGDWSENYFPKITQKPTKDIENNFCTIYSEFEKYVKKYRIINYDKYTFEITIKTRKEKFSSDKFWIVQPDEFRQEFSFTTGFTDITDAIHLMFRQYFIFNIVLSDKVTDSGYQIFNYKQEHDENKYEMTYEMKNKDEMKHEMKNKDEMKNKMQVNWINMNIDSLKEIARFEQLDHEWSINDFSNIISPNLNSDRFKQCYLEYSKYAVNKKYRIICLGKMTPFEIRYEYLAIEFLKSIDENYIDITDAIWIMSRQYFVLNILLYGQEDEFNIFRSYYFQKGTNDKESCKLLIAGTVAQTKLSLSFLAVVVQIALTAAIVYQVILDWDIETIFEDKEIIVFVCAVLVFIYLGFLSDATIKKCYKFYYNICAICTIPWYCIIGDFIANGIIPLTICLFSFFFLLQSETLGDLALNSFALTFLAQLDDDINVFESDEEYILSQDINMFVKQKKMMDSEKKRDGLINGKRQIHIVESGFVRILIFPVFIILNFYYVLKLIVIIFFYQAHRGNDKFIYDKNAGDKNASGENIKMKKIKSKSKENTMHSRY